MKLHQGLALIVATAFVVVKDVDGQTTYSCPSIGGGQTVLPAETLIRIPIVTDPNSLCTLVRHNATAGGTQRAPVARSFASRGSWEVSAGLFSNSATSGLSLDCDAGDGTTCDVTLPPVTNGQQYILETFTRPTLSAEALAARFLEQSTFGTTRESMNDLVARGLDYENWIIEQMNMPISSMREYYRKRTNPKYEFPYALGAVGSGPCDLYSRWRTYAVSILYAYLLFCAIRTSLNIGILIVIHFSSII